MGNFEGEGGIVTLYDENKNLLCQQFLNPNGQWYLNLNDSIELYATLHFLLFLKKELLCLLTILGADLVRKLEKE